MLRLVQYLQYYKTKFYFSTLSSIFNKVLDLMPPLLVGWLVDIVSGHSPQWLIPYTDNDPWKGAIFIGVATFVIFFFESFTEWMYSKGFLSIAQDVQHRLRIDTYDKLQNKPLSFFENNRTGNLLSIVNEDINRLERFFHDVYNEMIQITVLLIFSTIAFFSVSWQLAIFALIPIPFIIGGSVFYQIWIEKYYKNIRNQAGILNSRLENNISGIQVIKSFSTESFEKARVEQASKDYLDANQKAISYQVLYTPVIRMLVAVGFAGVLLLASYWVLNGLNEISVGQLALFGMLIQRLLWPLTRLGKVFDEWQRSLAGTQRIFQLIDEPEERIVGSVEMKENLKSGIYFNKVSFQYHQDGLPVFEDLSLVIQASKLTGIAGATGAGKSSLIKLILGFYPLNQGEIYFDQTPISQLDIHSLRQHISLVSQDVYLFQGTIAENIAYGKGNATIEEIHEASKKAAMHDFVVSLPQQYDTIVGERGIKLSGGQRQRLSIARAILKDAPIIVLDEATSAVDTETEKIIQENLQLLTKGKTAIIIAHRLSTMKNADQIIILDHGKIIEKGNHSELIQQGGSYAQLWDVQS
ncbi:MAG: ABC transporter ATP-binding protein/permease [Chitinophagales bacterium]|nr:ABC transporter ATP-binding protein/permease [Chitinophagales bacterium]